MRNQIWKRVAALVLSGAMVLGLAACGGNNGNSSSGTVSGGTSASSSAGNSGASSTPQGGVSEAVSKLAGAYAVDITALGMPLTFYLVIKEDGTFQLTNQVTDGAATGADKGNGQVRESSGVYMLVYSDSTASAAKTATFQPEGANLVFTSTLPYGASNIAPNTDGPTPIYAVAKSMAYGAYLGDYAGSLTKEVAAMGTSIVYDFSLNLGYGAEYSFKSNFSVMGSAQAYSQAGSFKVEGGKLTLTSTDGAVSEGTITEAGDITLTIPLSAMSKTGDEISMKRATTAAYAGSYSGVKNLQMGPMVMAITASLKLDMLGGYTYTAKIEGEEDYVQIGTYAPNADGTLTFTAAEEGAQAQTGTRGGSDSLTAKFKVSSAVPMATEIVFFSDRVQGAFEADDMEGKGSHGTLTLNPDGTYTFSVTGSVTVEDSGSFTTETGMAGDALTLVSVTGISSSGIISDAGINLNYTLSTGASMGYQLTPKAEESSGMGGGMPSGMGGSSSGSMPSGMGGSSSGSMPSGMGGTSSGSMPSGMGGSSSGSMPSGMGGSSSGSMPSGMGGSSPAANTVGAAELKTDLNTYQLSQAIVGTKEVKNTDGSTITVCLVPAGTVVTAPDGRVLAPEFLEFYSGSGLGDGGPCDYGPLTVDASEDGSLFFIYRIGSVSKQAADEAFYPMEDQQPVYVAADSLK